MGNLWVRPFLGLAVCAFLPGRRWLVASLLLATVASISF